MKRLELVLQRIVDAPREKVFEAWTDPTGLKQWLAPAPWNATVVHADPRAGMATLILWDKSEFMTVSVALEDLGGRTKYTAQVRHWATAETELETR